MDLPGRPIAADSNAAEAPRVFSRIDRPVAAGGKSVDALLRTPGMVETLARLLEAKRFADDVDADVWDFAVELPELRAAGTTTSEFRWLARKGLVLFARETTLPGDPTRSFRPLAGVTFPRRSCCVITSSGAEAAAGLLGDRLTNPSRIESVATPRDIPRLQPISVQRPSPHWDADLQELRVNGLIVKQFKVPAPNQEMVLAAFEEDGWPTRIDDPLPPQPDQDPKRRLHDTIVSLNRSHKHRLMRFLGDGSGEGVRWAPIVDAINDEQPAG